MGKLKEIWSNKWVKFSVVSILYTLLFVVWTGNLWLLLGLFIIFDIYISRFMYRLFWGKHKRLMRENKSYRSVMSWVEAILFALVVTTFIKFFLFAMYKIPTGSMEKTLLVGDYLWVSKLAYGPIVPNTPISFPLVHNKMPFSATKKSYSEAIYWPYHRLKGFGHVKRGDVVVFHFPAGDTVLVGRENQTYYDVLRGYQRIHGDEVGRARLNNDYTIIFHPVDKRENYVKRCVGMPGDSLRVAASEVYINGRKLPDPPGLEYLYVVLTNGTPINANTLEDMGMSQMDVNYYSESRTYVMPLTEANLKRVQGMSNVLAVNKYISDDVSPDIFPHDTLYKWNVDNMGPIWVPKKDVKVALTRESIPFYRDIIEKYEGPNKLEYRDGRVYLNDSVTDSYTFKLNYYFMMGDNRHNSADSRYWGFVPEDHVVGKPSFVWLSIDPDKSFPASIRWNKMFRGVKGLKAE